MGLLGRLGWGLATGHQQSPRFTPFWRQAGGELIGKRFANAILTSGSSTTSSSRKGSSGRCGKHDVGSNDSSGHQKNGVKPGCWLTKEKGQLG
jgi:hypothetical protein